ncbi:MAG: hypothetical protein PHX27_04445 [Candidatus ainarchaeum sp.]|nr:hypothetical protein [Candidatus ainarchaeum sp.]
MGKSIYVIAFVALVAIFFVTIFFIKSYEDNIFYSINNELRQIQLENQFESLFFDLIDEPSAYCEGREIQVSLSAKRLDLLDVELKAQRESFLGNYIPTKRSFLMTNMILLYSILKLDVDCDSVIKPVIYFYAEDNSCDIECGAMQNQLEQLKVSCPTARIFAFPFQWEEFVFSNIIEKEFDVNKAGTIIINNQKFDSIVKQEILEQALNCN